MPTYVGITDENNNLVSTRISDSVRALCVDIAGSTGSAATFSVANLLKTGQVMSQSSWTTVLTQTVPIGKTWYVKGFSVSSEAFASVRLKIDGVTSWQGRSDADDFNEITLHGIQLNAESVLTIEMDAGGVGKELDANLVIYEV